MNRSASILLCLASLPVLVSCGTFEIGIERTATPTARTAAMASITETPILPTRTIEPTASTPVPTSTSPAPSPVGTPTPDHSPSPWGGLPPGLVYRLAGALWAVDAQGRAVQVADSADAVLSPDGVSVIRYDLAEQDPWLLDRTTGTGHSLIRTPDRLECCFLWWPARPDVLVFGSVERSAERGPGTMGYLTAVHVDGTGYRLLDAEHDIGPGEFALSPDGQAIAYGGGSTGWLYRWGRGPEVLDLAAYGLTGYKALQVGSPAWSPDGAKLAWVVGGGIATDGDYRMAIAVLDVEVRTVTLIHPYQPIGRGGWPPAAAWNPDGRWLAFEAWARDPDDAGVWVVQVDGLGETEHHLGQGSDPVWSPDGEQMALYHIARGGERGIWVVERSTLELFPLGLPSDAAPVDWTAPSPDITSTTALPTTPTPVEVPTVPQVLSFRAMPAEVEPGDVITLSWEAMGDRAMICPSARFVLFTPDDCWQANLSGATTFTIPSETGGNRTIDFILSVYAEGSADPAMGQQSVAFKCHTTWFFSDEPRAGICPTAPIRSYAAVQRFERGTMVWLEQLGRYIILPEASSGDDEVRGPLAYLQDPLDIVRDTSADHTAPDGLYAPASGFGLVWRGDVAGSPGHRQTLGWALAPEFGYDAILQCDDALPSGGRSWQTCYLRGPDGEVIVLDPLDRWYLWEGWE